MRGYHNYTFHVVKWSNGQYLWTNQNESIILSYFVTHHYLPFVNYQCWQSFNRHVTPSLKI